MMISEKVLAILGNYTSTNKENISRSLKLSDDLGIDSVKIVNLIMDIEEEFEIEIDMSQIKIDSFKTVNSLISFVESIS